MDADTQLLATTGTAANGKTSGLGVLTIIIITLSALFSAIGFTNILIRLFYIFTPIPKFKKWWTKNMGRDLIIDQFSWSSIVICACIAPGNFVLPHYHFGKPVVDILTQCKRYALDWFISDGDKDTYEAIKGVFFAISIIALALKIFCCCCLKKGKLSSFILLVVTFVQSVVSVLGILLLPLIFHCVGQMDAHSTMDYFSIFFTILLFMTQLDSFHGNFCYGLISSFLVIFLPVSVCITIGVGKTKYVDVLTMALVYTIALSFITANSLYLTFFQRAKNKNWRWKVSMIVALIVKGVSMICGIVFLVLLRFDIGKDTSNFCVFLWLVWVLAPFFNMIPLIFGAKCLLLPGTGTYKKLLNG